MWKRVRPTLHGLVCAELRAGFTYVNTPILEDTEGRRVYLQRVTCDGCGKAMTDRLSVALCGAPPRPLTELIWR
jgi:hypothetical protein